MNTSIALLAVPVALSVGFVAGRLQAPEAPRAVAPLAQEQEMPPMSPELTAYYMPGEHHKLLDVFVGTWDASVAMVMPGMDEPMTMAGTMEARLVMDGRFLEQRFSADMAGMPFQGLSLMGYNGYEKVFESVWIDNSTTDIVTSTGFAAPDGVNFTMLAEMVDTETMQRREVEERIRIASRDQIVYEQWVPGGDGGQVKTLTVTYSRKAAAAEAAR